MSRPSCFNILAGIVLASLLAATANARMFVVRLDGTGDFPTIQAGLANLTFDSAGYSDTLIVEPGDYDEDLVVDPRGFFRCWILCPGGPQKTQVRSFRGPAPDSSFSSGTRLTISGLGIRGGFEFGHPRIGLVLDRCLFLGDVTLPRFRGAVGSMVVSCEFRGRFHVEGQSTAIRGCRFIGHTAEFFLLSDFPMTVEDCVFEGGTDTAAVVRSYDVDCVSFSGCVFRNVGTGLVVQGGLGGIKACGATVANCRFEDVSGAAIHLTRSGEPRPFWSRIGGCSFTRCGSAITGSSEHLLRLYMSADTLIDCRGVGIDAYVVEADLQDLLLQNGGAAGIVLKGRGSIAVSGCTITGGAGDALLLTHGESGDGSTIVRGNTIALNGGAGVRLACNAEIATRQSLEIESNLVAGNDEGGILVDVPHDGRIRFNDAWMNRGGDYSHAIDLTLNLSVDPQFCDALAGDFHVTSSSPCAPSGPYGPIGALGVGCDVMTASLEVQNQPINRRSNTPVEAAIFGHWLFDARRIDLSTVRLGGAVPSLRGNGKTATQVTDVNQDGLPDLLLSFNARDLTFVGGEVALEGRTFDNTPFRGSDAVEVRGTAFKAELESATAKSPTRLALSVLKTRGGMTLLLELPSSEPAKIEVFDVGGRRLSSMELPALGPGHHRLSFGERLPSGLYLARLRQGAAAVVARAVVLRLP
ncbi:MAG TPA: right-handed parallel beta-helix repeat-containing protein [Candidatus Eisenbacteria bacterium]|nr:right-handed parallel beta-helix repeat-containing protein [Candidatus Eisenbacteria bacterium]